ncbi:hypothetical protein LWI29_000692 [Acer saccharum]|uniref:Uncharacterized protein n=1 Tax=Acer saccharum TaxID=4024 RepID=A0AA39W1M6_ACESA|nr:hypothetical protein LWI29_000692 [Acer saccharum]
MCLCLMWKLKGYGPPTPHEIRHFYTLRQVGNGGTYFLLSSPVENWIPEGVANPGQVEVSNDEKKKGFIWGFPTSNKRWKNSWFFAGGEWGRDVPASSHRNFSTKRVPRHFTSSQTVLVLLDGEISHLAVATVLPLDERVCDFVTVYDLQAQAVKNYEATSKRHAAGLAKEGIASQDGDDHSDGMKLVILLGEGSNRGNPLCIQRLLRILLLRLPPAVKEKKNDLAPRASRGKRPAEGANAAVPSSEEVNELHVPASTPPQTASPSRVASPLVAMGEPDVSSGQPQPFGRSESADRPGPSKQHGVSTFGSGVAHEAPPVGSDEAGEGTVSLSDFSATEICLHLINNDVYIGEGWEHVKGKPCNKKMEFFFNCHSLLRESADGYLSAQIAVEEKLSAIEEEVHLLKEQLFASQESLAARLEVERVAEEAKEKAEREVLDLRNQLSSRELIFDNLKAVLEAEAVDRFKRSPAYDMLLLREFERGMRQSKKFFAMKDHSNENALRRFDRTEPHPMHLEIPSKRAFNTYYSGQKGSFFGFGAEPDLGSVAGRDYGPFMPDGDEEVTWPSEEEIEDEEDSEGPPTAS